MAEDTPSPIAVDGTRYHVDSDNVLREKHHHPGRPNKAEQLDIEMKVFACFKDKCKPKSAVKHTRLNIKTIKKYYKIFYKKIIYIHESEYFRNCRISKENTIFDLKKRKLILEKISDKLELKIDSLGENLTPKMQWLFLEQRKTQEVIAKLSLEINNLENTPTADVTLNQETAKIFKNQVVGGQAIAQ